MNRRIKFALGGFILLIATYYVTSYAFTNSFQWGYERGAYYKSYINGKPVKGIMSGERIIDTNNGGLALAISPLGMTGIVLFLGAFKGSIPAPAKKIMGYIWIGAIISFPVYAIVFVNILYDSMGKRNASNPTLAMFLPIVIAAIFMVVSLFREEVNS
jgi:hypothetical protein